MKWSYRKHKRRDSKKIGLGVEQMEGRLLLTGLWSGVGDNSDRLRRDDSLLISNYRTAQRELIPPDDGLQLVAEIDFLEDWQCSPNDAHYNDIFEQCTDELIASCSGTYKEITNPGGTFGNCTTSSGGIADP